MTDHVHDASCAVAHGDAPAPRDEPKTLVAIFASPMSAQLLRYALDLGYRTVLVEPDPTKLGPTRTSTPTAPCPLWTPRLSTATPTSWSATTTATSSAR